MLNKSKHTAFIALGANLGNPAEQIVQALRILAQSVTLIKTSSMMRSRPLLLNNKSSEAEPDYINSVVQIETELTPLDLLDLLLSIESRMGRTRREKWESRVIDLDLIAYDKLVLSSERLTLPHPEMMRRDFVLKPLAEIAPEWTHPIGGQKIKDLIQGLHGFI